jgi:hypothetical protein
MSKKQYRKVKANPSMETPIASTSTSTRTRSSSAEFNPDYTYVKQDLKRIAIMAVSFIGVLVILSFFLR